MATTLAPALVGREVDKVEARRAELADATLQTLGELGFARTSLREIAKATEYSHGLLHYYFRDKVELITYCVRRYKEHCVTRYDDIVALAGEPGQLRRGFADALVVTLLDETAMHRLWYDIRSQAMFEAGLRPTVVDLDGQLQDMVWRVVRRYAELAGRDLLVTPAMAYALFDGVFEQALLRHLAGDAGAGDRLRDDADRLLGMLVGD
jgi:AcrR family transcriptional regulator